MMEYIQKKWDCVIENIEKENFSAFFLLILLFFAALCYVALFSDAPVRNVMEARNLRTAEEIVESGNWLFPTLNGRPRILKPPLPTWSAAAAAKMIGDTRNVFFLRIPNLLCCLMLLVFTYLLTKDIYGKRAALFASLMLATSVKLFGEIQSARWDMFVTSFSIATLWAARSIFVPNGTGKKISYFLLASLLAIASYLSKGPVGIALVFAPFGMAFLVFYFLMGKRGDISWSTNSQNPEEQTASRPLFFSPKSWSHWTVLFLLVVVYFVLGNGWWFLSQMQYPDTWKDLYSDIVSVNTSRVEAWYYYFERVPGLIAPWTSFFLLSIVLGAVCMYRAVRVWMGRKEEKDAESTPVKFGNEGLLFAFLWFMASFTVLCLVPAKKNRYFFTVMPSACVMMSVCCNYLISYPWKDCKAIFYLIALQKFVLFLAAILFPLILLVTPFFVSPWILAIWPLLLLASICLLKKELNITRVILDTSLYTAIGSAAIFIFIYMTPWNKNGYEAMHSLRSHIQQEDLYILRYEDDDEMLWAMGRNFKTVPRLSELPSQIDGSFLMLPTYIEGSDREMAHFLQTRSCSAQKIHSFDITSNKKIKRWELYKIKR